ncbi:MAG: hypothetical protein R3E32_18425 [Chitinophagales bacterium]
MEVTRNTYEEGISQAAHESEADKIELRSEEMQDILGYVPHWIVRWGASVILSVLVLLILISYLVKYPDVIPARITLQTQSPPIPVISRNSGKLIQLTVQNDDIVVKDQIVGILNSSTDTLAVKQLKTQLQKMEGLSINSSIGKLQLKPVNHLGALEDVYAQLLRSVNDYQSFLRNQNPTKRVNAVQDQIAAFKNLGAELERQRGIYQRNVEIAKGNYYRYQQALRTGGVSMVQVEQAEAELLRNIQSLANLEARIQENNLQITSQNTGIVEINSNASDQENSLQQNIEQSLSSVKAQLANWELNYILRASIDGTVSLPDRIKLQQNIQMAEEVMTIVPVGGEQQIVGKMQLPIFGVGKVKIGQRVNIKLDSYPNTEFGMLHTAVADIAAVPRESFYEATVYLPDVLISNYKKELPFKQGMQGTAEVITEDLRLIERIFNQMKSIFKSNT